MVDPIENIYENIILSFINKPKETFEIVEKYGLSEEDFCTVIDTKKVFNSLLILFKQDGNVSKETLRLSIKDYHGDSEAHRLVDYFYGKSDTFNLDSLETHIRTIKVHSIKHNISKQIKEFQKSIQAFKYEDSIPQLYETSQNHFNTIMDVIYDPIASMSSVGSYVDQFVRYMEDDGDIYVPTGFPLYDAACGGLRVGAMNLSDARPGVGKSMYALNAAYQIALRGNPVGILDSELDYQYFMARLLSLATGIPIKTIEDKRTWAQPTNLREYLQAILDHVIKKLPIYYKYIGGLTLQQILAYCKQFVQEHNDKIPVVIYDYLMVANSKDLSNTKLSETQIIGNMLCDIQDTIVRYQFPMMIFAQTNRSGIKEAVDGTVAMSDRFSWKSSTIARIMKVDPEEEENLGCNRTLTFTKTRFSDDFVNHIRYDAKFEIARFCELDGITV